MTGPSPDDSKIRKATGGLTARVVRRPILVLMAYAAVTMFGVFSLRLLPIDQLPDVEPPVITVITVYPAAGPSDVESKVTDVIEKSVGSISGLDRVTSISKENMSVVTCEFLFGTDLETAADEIRQHLELAKPKLPDDARDPMIFKFNTSMFPVYIVGVRALRGDVRAYRKEIRETMVDNLERIPGVGSAIMYNAPERQVLIEVHRRRLDARKISLLRLTQTLERASFAVPAGRMEHARKDLPVSVAGDYQTLGDIEKTPVGFSVIPSFGGAVRPGLQEPLSSELGVVRLEDVARVRWGYPSRRSAAQYDGKDSIWIMLFRRSGANTVEVADRITEELDALTARLPSELEVVPILDGAENIRQTVENLTQTVIIGGLLVLVVIFLFLRRLRSSVVVAVTIPVSLMVTFVGLYLMDYTINSISLIGMALAIGMVVDNAIVVLESVVRHVEQGTEPHAAAIKGTREVGLAISAATLTTIVIFAPLVFVRGFVGEFLGHLSFVVILTLVASLITALIVTPTMTARLLRRHAPVERGEGEKLSAHEAKKRLAGKRGHWWLLEWLYIKSERGFSAFERGYGELVAAALRHRLLVVAIALLLAGGSGALVYLTGVDFVIKDDQGFIQVQIEMESGTPVEETARVAAFAAGQLRKQPETMKTFFSAGTTETAMLSSIGGKEGPNIAQVYTRLIGKLERKRSEEEVAEPIAEMLRKKHPEAKFSVKTGNPLGQALMGAQKPIVINIQGKDFRSIGEAAESVRRTVEATEGTRDVELELMDTRPEFRVEVDRKRAQGSLLNSFFLGATLRVALYGRKIGIFRGSDEEAELFLKLDEDDRDSPADIEALKITTGIPSLGQPLVGPNGATLLLGHGAEKMVRLGNVAKMVRDERPVEIRHLDKRRLAVVSARYEGRALGDIIADLDSAFGALDLPDDVTISYGSQVKQQKETFSDLVIVLLLGIALVYMVMASQFESLLDPFVIMFSLPFAFSGVFLGFHLTGTKLSLPAFMGLIVLMGVVVNNAIVLIDYAKQLRTSGLGLDEALRVAGRRRLRPVLMTTFTTVCGMLPLALSRAEGAFIWAPLGQAVASGLIFSTLVTLILVPTVYSLLEPLRRARHRKRSG
jgi:HAE1 family hydrophobic/amphiphilic exporter-1